MISELSPSFERFIDHMQTTTLLGFVLGIGGILLGNYIEGGHVGSLAQGAAGIIVFLGTLGAVVVSSRKEDLVLSWQLFKKTMSKDSLSDSQEAFNEIIEFSKLARKETILSLEPKIPNIKDPFLRNIIRAVVDGVEAKTIKEVFEKQISIEEEKLLGGAKVWIEAGGYAPTVGIIGAVLGLIHVMGNLSDTSKLGAGIAVAFVATVYGVGSANLIFLPMGSRIKKWIAEQIKYKEMILEGGLSIQAALPAHLAELKLRPYVEVEDSKA